MLIPFAQAILGILAIYFIGLGVISLVAPNRARAFLLGFAASAGKHYAEIAIRVLVGVALVLLAPSTQFQPILAAFGWLLVGSSLAMLLAPWRFHQRFAHTMVPKALRYLPLIGIASLAFGGFLIRVVLGVSAT